jgi:hypothetical protein
MPKMSGRQSAEGMSEMQPIFGRATLPQHRDYHLNFRIPGSRPRNFAGRSWRRIEFSKFSHAVHAAPLVEKVGNIMHFSAKPGCIAPYH